MNHASHQAALQKAGVAFTEGLSDAELSAIEARGRFVFPPDLRAFLQAALPVSHGLVDWRALSDAPPLHMPGRSCFPDVQTTPLDAGPG